MSDKRDGEERRVKEQREKERRERERIQEEEEEERKRQQTHAEAVPSEWTCEVCTLINEVAEMVSLLHPWPADGELTKYSVLPGMRQSAACRLCSPNCTGSQKERAS